MWELLLKELFIYIIQMILTSWIDGDAGWVMQFGFQDIATTKMGLIWMFHHDLMVILIFVILFVSRFLWVLSHAAVREGFRYIPYTERPVVKHNFLEAVWTLLPASLLTVVLVPSVLLMYLSDGIDAPCIMTVKVIGHQWYWSYEFGFELDFVGLFSDHVHTDWLGLNMRFDAYLVKKGDWASAFRLLVTDQFVFLMCNYNTRLLITSTDVIHSWAVPSFGIKIDACPGRLNLSHVNVWRQAVFFGQCSELCGVQHGFMPISLVVINPMWWISYASVFYTMNILKWLIRVETKNLFNYNQFFAK
jgi:cytochrome c oxidase subunit 2